MTWLRRIDKSQLHPGLVNVMELALAKLEAEGTPFKVYSGLRTFEQQNKLYAQGRTTGKKGKIVTKARGGQSMHNYGLAVDLAPFNLLTEDPDDLWWPDPDQRSGKIWYVLEDALSNAVQELHHKSLVADTVGLTRGSEEGLDYEWGGRWNFRDVPHCQIRTTLPELQSGHYPYCSDVEWLVRAHNTFLYNTPWLKRRVQYLLSMQSYDVGVVDGIWGDQTDGAIARFQNDQKLSLELGEVKLLHSTVERLVRLHQTGMSTPKGTLPEDLVG